MNPGAVTSALLPQEHHKGLLSKCASFSACFVKLKGSNRSKGWSFLIPGKFFDRLETHFVTDANCI